MASPGQLEMQRLNDAGFTSEEVAAWQAEQRGKLSAAGFSQPEVDEYFGRAPFNAEGMRTLVKTNLTPPEPEAPAEPSAKDKAEFDAVWEASSTEGFLDHLMAGLQLSTSGLAIRGKMPSREAREYPEFTERLGFNAGMVVGDLPAMVGGYLIGGGQVTGVAGAFALPAGLRATLVDGYTKGEFTDFKDFWDRSSSIIMETVKAEALGLATGAAGKAASMVKTPLPVVNAVIPTTAELTTMVTVGAALEGHAPKWQDFLDMGFLLLGFKGAKYGAEKLAEIYVRTGMRPEQVQEAAMKDTSILQDIATNKPGIPGGLAGAADPTIKASPAKTAEIKAAPGGAESAPGLTGKVPPLQVSVLNTAAPTGGGGKPPAKTAPPAPPAPPAGSPEQIVNSRISFEEPAKTRTTFREFYRKVVDQFSPVKEFTEAMGGAANAKVDPYKVMRLAAGSYGRAGAFLDFSAFDFATLRDAGPGLKKVLKPVEKDIEGFRTYAVAARAVELEARGVETGIDNAAARAVVKSGKGKYDAPFRELVEYQNTLTRYLRDSGVIGKDTYEAMTQANQNYVPFYRFFGDEFGGPGQAGRGFAVRNPVKKIKGSDEMIVDPLEAIIKNTYLFITLAERNRAGVEFWKMVKADPATAEALGVKVKPAPIRPVEVAEPEVRKFLEDHGLDPNAAEAFTIFRAKKNPVAADEVRFFVDGKAVTLEVTEPLAQAFKNMDSETFGTMVKIAAVPAKALRAGSVLSPDFFLRNLARDQMQAFVQAKGWKMPVYETLDGAFSILSKDAAFQSWLKGGGANSAFVSIDRQYIQQNVWKLSAETGLLDKTWNVIRSPLEMLRITSELIENATRVGEFKRQAQGRTDAASVMDAAFDSREVTLDFARTGANTKALNLITAFWQARVNGMDTLIRAFKDRPTETTVKAVAAITLPSLILWSVNHHDPRWKDIPRWQKDLFWIVFTDNWEEPASPTQLAAMQAAGMARQSKDGRWFVNNGTTYRIPKPYELGVIFGSFPERVADKYIAENPEGLKDFGGNLLKNIGIDMVPTFASPIVEQFANRSRFTNNPIIPSNVEGWLPEYQYTPYTSETAKQIAGMIGHIPGVQKTAISPESGPIQGVARALATPALIDNYVSGWTGGLGRYVLQIADAGLVKAGVAPDPMKPMKTLADMPVIKAFVVRYPSATAQSVQDFYDRYYTSKKAFDTIMGLAKRGDIAAAQKEMELHPADMAQIGSMREALSNLNNVIQMVNKNPEMTPEEKRQLIDTLYYQMIVISQSGNVLLDQIDKTMDVER